MPTRPRPPCVLSLTPRAVLEPVHRERIGRLAPHRLVFADRSPSATAHALADADFVLGDWTHETGLDAHRLDLATHCQVIFQPTTGTEDIDLERAAELGIPVANAPGHNDVAVAEWTVMAILALLKEAWRHHAGVQAGRWDMVAAAEVGVYELAGRSIGIVGMGRIGQAVARRLQPFAPKRLVYFDEVPAPPGFERELGLERLELDEL